MLTNELHVSALNFSSNNTIIEFESTITININQLNALLSTIGTYTVSTINELPIAANIEDKPSYKPIYLIFFYLLLINTIISAKNMQFDSFMANFMATFFLIFSFFKLLDLDGFARGYSAYDIIAKKFYRYGYIYPFIEFGLGIGYILFPTNLYFNIGVFFLMFVSSIGVIKAKLSKQKFDCACVGTFLKVPLGSIAIIEDILMTVLALVMILKII